MSDREERLENALQQIAQWANAYPADIFSEPDFKRADAVLKQHDISMTAMHGTWGRYLMTRVKKIAEEALKP